MKNTHNHTSYFISKHLKIITKQMKIILKYQSLKGLFLRQLWRVWQRHHRRSQNYHTFLLHFLLLRQLVNQIIIFIVFVVVIDKVSEMVFASRSSVAVLLDFRFVVLTGELKGGFAGFDDLLAGHVGFGVLFFDFLLAFWLIILADGAFVGRVIQQINGEGFQFGQNVSGPGDSLVVLQRFVVFSV